MTQRARVEAAEREVIAPLPCPWCGDVAPVVGRERTVPPSFFAQCSNRSCLAAGPSCEYAAAAVAAWNRVVRLAARGAEVEGATEGWIVESASPPEHWPDIGHVYKTRETADHERGLLGFHHWNIRRVLILPPSVESGGTNG